MRVAVMTPTYNEHSNILRFLEEVTQAVPEYDVFVVDDDSPDRTANHVTEVMKSNPRVKLITRKEDRGFAAACREGTTVICGLGYDVIVLMDADLSHDPKVIPSMIAKIEQGAGVVIGSRYVSGGGIENWTIFRRFLSFWGNVYTRALLGLAVRDCTSGFRAYHSSIINSGAITSTTSHGYAFQTEVLLRVRDLTQRPIVEVPIVYVNRTLGESKMSKTIIGESMRRVTLWGLRRLMSQAQGRRR